MCYVQNLLTPGFVHAPTRLIPTCGMVLYSPLTQQPYAGNFAVANLENKSDMRLRIWMILCMSLQSN